MDTQVQDRTLTQSLNASPYAEAARLAAQKQMLEQDMAAQMPQAQPKPQESQQEAAQQVAPGAEKAKPHPVQQATPSAKTELMSPEELAQHKASIQQLYAEKDQTLQQLQRTPKSTVKDGVLLGTGLGAAATLGIKMVGDYQAHAMDEVRKLLNDFTNLSKGVTLDAGFIDKNLDAANPVIQNFAKAMGVIPEKAAEGETPPIPNEIVDQIKGYLTQAIQYGGKANLQETIKTQITSKFQSANPGATVDENLINGLTTRILKAVESGKELNLKDLKNVPKGLKIEDIKPNKILEDINKGISSYKADPVFTAIKENAETGVDKISKTIAKIPGVKEEFVKQVFDNVAGNTQNAQGATDRVAQIGTIAAIVGTTVAICAVGNWALNQGKNQKHDKLKSHVDRLDEKILQEQQALKAGLGI